MVAIYRDCLLYKSETFIRAQAEAIRRYRPHYVCMRRVSDLDFADGRVLVLNRGDVVGRASERAFKAFGISPLVTRAARRLRPAVLHAHMGPDGAVALPLARQLGVPLVVTFHGYDATMTDDALRRSRLGRIYVRRRETLARQARLFIAVSDFIRGELLERGYPEEKVIVHRIGVDTELFGADPTVAREPIVLFVGRLAEKKGVTHLISAMRSVQARIPHAELVVIGEGSLRSQLERQVQEQAVRARFLGRQSPSEVRGWMNRAHLLCVPSVRAADGDAEGLPIVLVEAMAMGLPVVGSRSAGIPEAVVQGVTGLLVPSGDAGALAEGIETLLTDTAAWQRMSAAGVQHVRERFDLRRQTAELEALYDRVRGRAITASG